MTGFLVLAGLLGLIALWVVLTNNSFVRARPRRGRGGRRGALTGDRAV